MKRHKITSLLIAVVLILSAIATPILADGGETTTRPDGWSEESHSKSADLDYDIVFPQDEVNTITITIEPDEWQAMLDDMTNLYGEFGTGGGMGGPGDGNRPEMGQAQLPPGVELPEGMTAEEFMQSMMNGEIPEGFEPPAGMMAGGMDAPGGLSLGSDDNPIWVAVDIEMDGVVWTNVGMRFKGNSSLMSTWSEGSFKLPFKLDFDEFEDDYPEIDDQRFYGFRQVSFSSNWSDASYLREKATADIFREAGVPSAETAFYAVYVDYGEGPVYFGLYTAVEVIDDTVIETQFDDDSGNVYKPENSGATFANGTFNESDFDKETNQDENDYSDILALYDVLHAETRTTDPAAWRSALESVFDVDTFLNWLAVNQVVQNWDTYGQMAHNYYLYTDPTTGLITWIPWDNNMALAEGRGGGGGMARPEGGRDNNAGGGGRGGMMPGGMGDSSLSIDLDSVSEDWPLIRYLLDDPVYHDVYVSYVEASINGAFAPAQMAETYDELHELIAPYVAAETADHTTASSLDAFEASVEQLISHAYDRYTEAQNYVETQVKAQ